MIDLDDMEKLSQSMIERGIGHTETGASCYEAIELVTRLRQAEKDAARYRWVIEQFWFQDEASWRLNIKESELSVEFSCDVGNAIDEAMKCK